MPPWTGSAESAQSGPSPLHQACPDIRMGLPTHHHPTRPLRLHVETSGWWQDAAGLWWLVDACVGQAGQLTRSRPPDGRVGARPSGGRSGRVEGGRGPNGPGVPRRLTRWSFLQPGASSGPGRRRRARRVVTSARRSVEPGPHRTEPRSFLELASRPSARAGARTRPAERLRRPGWCLIVAARRPRTS